MPLTLEEAKAFYKWYAAENEKMMEAADNFKLKVADEVMFATDSPMVPREETTGGANQEDLPGTSVPVKSSSLLKPTGL